MIELYYQGGALFMGILTLIFLSVFVVTAILLLRNLKQGQQEPINYNIIKSIGLFALVIGVLGQFIGLYSAFESIAKAGEVSQAILASGLKVSSITTIYGIIILIVSYLLWFGLSAYNEKISVEVS